MNPQNEKWTKRDRTTGEFIDQKADENRFKGVRREKKRRGNSMEKQMTSTGIPVNQAYTPPTAESYRPKKAIVPDRNVFKNIFPDESESRLPSSDTINKPLAYVSEIILDLENFPQFFENLERIEKAEGNITRWFFQGDENFPITLGFRSLNKGRTFVWKTTDAVGFDYTLAIHLEPAQADRGTIVRVMTAYDSKVTEILSKLELIFGKDALGAAKKNLQRLKAFCETGHVPTTEGQPSGRDEDSVILSPEENQSVLKH